MHLLQRYPVRTAGFLLLAILLAFISFLFLRPRAARLTVVQPENIIRKVALEGRLEPLVDLDLRAPQPGHVAALSKDDGDAVRKDELLARIEPQGELRSPVEGKVLRRRVQAGDTVERSTVLYTLQGEDSRIVEVSLPENFAADVHDRAHAEGATPGRAHVYDLSLCSIDAQPSARTNLRRARFCFSESASDLPPGMTLDVTLEVAREQRVLAVPLSAVQSDGRARFVFVAEQGHARRRAVDVEDWPSDRRVVVRSGLSPGDSVIVNAFEVRDGLPIRISR